MNILITGGTKGIGRAIANLFAEQQANVAIVARSAEDLIRTRAELLADKSGIEVLAKNCDLSRKGNLDELVEWLTERWDTLDVLVNNAGVFIPGTFQEEATATFEKTLAINLLAPYSLTKLLLPLLQRAAKPHIFNICSVASREPRPDAIAYSISKYALLGFTQNLREGLKESAIRVTAVLPGATLTSSWDGEAVNPEDFIPAQDVAKAVWSTYQMSPQTVIEEIVLNPKK